MRTISLILLSTLELSWTLACLAIQDLELAEPPAQATRTLRSLDGTRNLRPRSFPGTRPNSLLAVFSSPTSRYPTSLTAFELASLVENSPDIATAHTSSVQPTSDASDYSSTSSWAAPKFFSNSREPDITMVSSYVRRSRTCSAYLMLVSEIGQLFIPQPFREKERRARNRCLRTFQTRFARKQGTASLHGAHG